MTRRLLPRKGFALLCAALLLLASVYLPPYRANFDHWLPLIAAANAIRAGAWPYLGGFDAGYGLLCPAFVALWLAGLGVSLASLNGLLMLGNLFAGGATFALIRRLTGSRLLALLCALYLLQGIAEDIVTGTRMFAVSSTLRAPVQIALGGLLLYLSLRDRRGRWWLGFLFGLTVLWNPPFGMFAAIGFLAAHGWQIAMSPGSDRRARLYKVVAMLAGVFLPLAAIWIRAEGHSFAARSLFDPVSGNTQLFLLGYGNTAQTFDPVLMLLFVVVLLYLALLLHRLPRSASLSPRALFVGASLIGSVPYLAYAFGRADTLHYLPLYWALMPSAALLAYGFVRLSRARFQSNAAAGKHSAYLQWAILLACVYLWGSFPLQRALTTKHFANAYQLESARRPAGEPPSLMALLSRAAEPLWQGGHFSFDPRLIEACRTRLVVVSYSDAWIYAAGDCYSPIRVPSVNFLLLQAEVEQYLRRLSALEHIVFDPAPTVYAQWKGNMLSAIRTRLLEQGFGETSGCGRFTILSRTDPAPVLRRLCAAAPA